MAAALAILRLFAGSAVTAALTAAAALNLIVSVFHFAV
jgi:hypothetical protein